MAIVGARLAVEGRRQTPNWLSFPLPHCMRSVDSAAESQRLAFHCCASGRPFLSCIDRLAPSLDLIFIFSLLLLSIGFPSRSLYLSRHSALGTQLDFSLPSPSLVLLSIILITMASGAVCGGACQPLTPGPPLTSNDDALCKSCSESFAARRSTRTLPSLAFAK